MFLGKFTRKQRCRRTKMANWSELHHDMLVNIARRINLIEDYLNFAGVCKPWRRAATKENFNSDLPRVPWLMLPEEEDFPDKGYNDGSSWRKFFSSYIGKVFKKKTPKADDGNSCRKFVSLYNGMVLKKRIPNARRKKCLECMGWLITIGMDEEISLLHPFSGVQIELPYLSDYDARTRFHPWTIYKAAFSASPSQPSDYTVLVIEGFNNYFDNSTNYLSFWRPGDLKWNRIGRENYDYLDDPRYRHCDVVYFDGKFYVVDWQGRLLVCDVNSADPKAQIVSQVPQHLSGDDFYILESLGSLFVVARYGGHYPNRGVHSDINFEIRHFQVYKIDLAAEEVVVTKDIGDRAFFLGFNASQSVQASQFPGVKRNCIYFTHINEIGGGVFNLADGTFEPHYKRISLSRVNPPIWVTPTLY